MPICKISPPPSLRLDRSEEIRAFLGRWDDYTGFRQALINKAAKAVEIPLAGLGIRRCELLAGRLVESQGRKGDLLPFHGSVDELDWESLYYVEANSSGVDVDAFRVLDFWIDIPERQLRSEGKEGPCKALRKQFERTAQRPFRLERTGRKDFSFLFLEGAIPGGLFEETVEPLEEIRRIFDEFERRWNEEESKVDAWVEREKARLAKENWEEADEAKGGHPDSEDANLKRILEEAKQRKDGARLLLEKERDERIESAKEGESIRRIHAYALVEPGLRLDESRFELPLGLKPDMSGEETLLKRQQEGIRAFRLGAVRNPLLPAFLLDPRSLPPLKTEEPERWYLPTLNDKQKEAVRRCLASDGIFLLQGPPGTGKTQVLAEAIAHLAENGKKVLVTSETHKAIDNVLERLPSLTGVLPVRLVGKTARGRRKEDAFSLSGLTARFYKGICSTINSFLQDAEGKQDDFRELESSLGELNSLLERIRRIEREKRVQLDGLKRAEEALDDIRLSSDQTYDKIQAKEGEASELKREWERFRKGGNAGALAEMVVAAMEECWRAEFPSIEMPLGSLPFLAEMDVEVFLAERELLWEGDRRKASSILLRRRLALVDEDSPEADKIRKAYQALQKETGGRPLGSSDLEQLPDFLLLPLEKGDKKALETLLEDAKGCARNCLNKGEKAVELLSRKLDSEIARLRKESERLERECRRAEVEAALKREEAQSGDLEGARRALALKQEQFAKKFGIPLFADSPSDYLERAQRELEGKREGVERLSASLRSFKAPMKEISDYLSEPALADEDSERYSNELFGLANVIGATCMSGKSLVPQAGGGESLDLRSLGIDVVVVDEASKSSFLTLLPPLLYGKTVILSGDQRQLPPMYDLAHAKAEDFIGLEGISPEEAERKNKEFREEYETSHFGRLFGMVPDDHKITLVQQYRSHQEIMEAYNVFYDGKLELGSPEQNKAKAHGLRIREGFIWPRHSVYFVDCPAPYFEERLRHSTTIKNEYEARAVRLLLSDIATAMGSSGQRLSIGVISTYGAQAHLISKMIEADPSLRKYRAEDGTRIVSRTVDDFQGDERDIIILSMVRNPRNPMKSNPGFINAYQRINVSLSRPRRLLIIVGCRSYLESHGVASIPPLGGNGAPRRVQIYKEIIDQLEDRRAVRSVRSLFGQEEAK